MLTLYGVLYPSCAVLDVGPFRLDTVANSVGVRSAKCCVANSVGVAVEAQS